MFALAILNRETNTFLAVRVGKTKDELKAYRAENHKRKSFRIFEITETSTFDKALSKVNQAYQASLKLKNGERSQSVNKASKLSKFSYADIVELMLSDATYKHVVMFDSRHDAVTYVNNFTGTIARSSDGEHKGKFQTNIAVSIMLDKVVFSVVFQTKGDADTTE